MNGRGSFSAPLPSTVLIRFGTVSGHSTSIQPTFHRSLAYDIHEVNVRLAKQSERKNVGGDSGIYRPVVNQCATLVDSKTWYSS